jgi:hypothetical protein
LQESWRRPVSDGEHPAPKIPEKWWELAEDRWEELYEKRRLDAAVEELKDLSLIWKSKQADCLTKTSLLRL